MNCLTQVFICDQPADVEDYLSSVLRTRPTALEKEIAWKEFGGMVMIFEEVRSGLGSQGQY